MADEKEEQDNVNKNYKSQLDTHTDQLKQHLEILSELGKKCKDNRTYCDKLQDKSDKAFNKIDHNRSEMF